MSAIMDGDRLQTQSQRDLARAAQRVSEIKDRPWKKQYGGLCHSFPILVRTAGLAQAVEFIRSKAASSEAHQRVVEDCQDLLQDFSPGTASLTAYMRATRRVLRAWVFYKRFAKSILNADAGDDDNGG